MKQLLMRSCLALSFGLSAPAFSHHSLSMYTPEMITVVGTIEEVRAVNPHVTILIKTDVEAGEAPYWLVETESKINLEGHQGVDLDVLQPGMTITVTGRKGQRDNMMFIPVGGITPGPQPATRAGGEGRGGTLILEDGTVFFPPGSQD